MSILLTLCSSIATIVIIVVTIRLLLKQKSNELSLRIENNSSYQSSLKNKEELKPKEETLQQEGEQSFTDIKSDLKQTFYGKYITFREEKYFTDYYTNLFHEVNNLLKRLETFHVEPSETILKFVSDFENLQWLIKNHNDV